MRRIAYYKQEGLPLTDPSLYDEGDALAWGADVPKDYATKQPLPRSRWPVGDEARFIKRVKKLEVYIKARAFDLLIKDSLPDPGTGKADKNWADWLNKIYASGYEQPQNNGGAL